MVSATSEPMRGAFGAARSAARLTAALRLCLRCAPAQSPEVRRYRPVQVVGQLRGSLERELDLAVEARNTERFAHNFADDLDILVPRVYSE